LVYNVWGKVELPEEVGDGEPEEGGSQQGIQRTEGFNEAHHDHRLGL
jgi:hypothetical protein